MKFKNRIIIFLILLIFISSISFIIKQNSNGNISFIELNNSISRGVDFLYRSQSESGQYISYTCTNKIMVGCFTDNSPFMTALVLYSIKDIKNPDIPVMTSKALKFLLGGEENGGVWRYWLNKTPALVPPDLDDTSVISFILNANNISIENNRRIIEQNKDSQGVFYTWLNTSSENNNIDCVVNANILLYLGNNSDICNYINNAIKNDENCSVYYPDKIDLYYTVAKDFSNNVSCLVDSKNIIIQRVLSTQNPDGSFGNPLQTAISVTTLMDFGYSSIELNKSVEAIVKRQNKDGSWSKEIFFTGPHNTYFGSEDLTTAFSIEALNKYLNENSGNRII